MKQDIASFASNHASTGYPVKVERSLHASVTHLEEARTPVVSRAGYLPAWSTPTRLQRDFQKLILALYQQSKTAGN